MLRHLKMPAAVAALLLSAASTLPARSAEPSAPNEARLLSLPTEAPASASECRVARTRYFRVNGRRVRARYSHTGYKRINGRRVKVRYYRRY